MYEEYLGFGYHERVRKMLGVDEFLLPNEVIDADNNIQAMKILTSIAVKTMLDEGKSIKTQEQYDKFVDIALGYLCGILCIALKTRTAKEPFNNSIYQQDWDKKCSNFINCANSKMLELIESL